ncbi:MAG: tyrosine-type recombinase/integrase [Cyanobacteria bacterium J06635_11]
MTKPTPSTTEIIEQWLYGRPKTTQEAYLRDATLCLRFLGDPLLGSITLEDLQRYQSHLIEVRHCKPRTVNRKLSALRTLLKFAHEQEFIPRNPAVALRSPKIHESFQERILTREQVRVILDAAPAGRDQALLSFVYITGCRVSEACQLLWKDISPKTDGSAVVRLLGKRDKWRSVRLPKQVWHLFEALRGNALDDDLVFGLARRQAHDVMKAAATKAGVPDASMHWLRHSLASHALDAGAPISVVRDTLGHASIQTTDKYLHSNPDESAGDYLDL